MEKSTQYGLPKAQWRRLASPGDQADPTANTTINLNDTGEGLGIPWASNKGTLAVGESYKLTARCRNWGDAGDDYFHFQWWDVTNGAWLGLPGFCISIASSTNDGAQPVAVATITPIVTTEVELRVKTIGPGGAGIRGDCSGAMIEQL